jgi:hypothetical protein
MLGSWLVVLIAGTIGATNALLSLRLSRFGASGVEIGVTFVLAPLLRALLTPWVGRVVDRQGIVVPLAVGLGGRPLLIALLPVPQEAIPLAVLTVAALGGPLVGAEMAAVARERALGGHGFRRRTLLAPVGAVSPSRRERSERVRRSVSGSGGIRAASQPPRALRCANKTA